MSINLEKRVETARIHLEKKQILHIPCEVGLLLDASGSMRGDFVKGHVQDVLERVLAIAMNVDVDKKVDAWAFDTGVYELETITPENITDYVNQHAMKKCRWGYTSYSPAIGAAVNRYFPKKSFLSDIYPFGSGKKQSAAPILLLHVTDGMCDDTADTMKLLTSVKDKNVYVMFIGIGSEDFSFLQAAADALPNCGFMSLENISEITDDDLYSGIICDEFAAWIKNFE